MRLTTLARKIKITPTKLAAFLEQNSIDLNNGINTKLDEKTIALVKENFASTEDEEANKEIEISIEAQEEELVIETAQSEPSADVETTIEAAVIETEEIVDEIVEAPTKEEVEPETQNETIEVEEEAPTLTPKIGTVDDLEEGNAEGIDLIKVKKVKLEGIKVVGKIELPEKPQKEEQKDDHPPTEEAERETNQSTSLKSKSEKPARKKLKRSQKHRQPLSYEEKLRREERDKRRQIKAKQRKEKARKKEHYLKTVKTKSTVAGPKKKKKQSPQQAKNPNTIIVHRNPIRRLWAWLNGEYDKH